MERIDPHHEIIEQYLLGNLDQEQREQVEMHILTDAEFKEKALVVEDELIEKYIDGTLTETERERFDKYFLPTPQQRQRVKIERMLRAYATAWKAEGSRLQPVEARQPGNWRRRLAALLRFNHPILAVGLMAAVLATIFVGWRLVSSWQSQNRRAAIERVLAQLNNQQAPQQPGVGQQNAVTLQVSLPPDLLLRGSPAARDVSPPGVMITGDISLVQFQLRLLTDEHQSYRAVFKTKDGVELFAAADLKTSAVGRERVVSVTAPAGLFDGDDYIIQLVGLDSVGQAATVGDYPFRVVRR